MRLGQIQYHPCARLGKKTTENYVIPDLLLVPKVPCLSLLHFSMPLPKAPKFSLATGITVIFGNGKVSSGSPTMIAAEKLFVWQRGVDIPFKFKQNGNFTSDTFSELLYTKKSGTTYLKLKKINKIQCWILKGQTFPCAHTIFHMLIKYLPIVKNTMGLVMLVSNFIHYEWS